MRSCYFFLKIHAHKHNSFNTLLESFKSLSLSVLLLMTINMCVLVKKEIEKNLLFQISKHHRVECVCDRMLFEINKYRTCGFVCCRLLKVVIWLQVFHVIMALITTKFKAPQSILICTEQSYLKLKPFTSRMKNITTFFLLRR